MSLRILRWNPTSMRHWLEKRLTYSDESYHASQKPASIKCELNCFQLIVPHKTHSLDVCPILRLPAKSGFKIKQGNLAKMINLISESSFVDVRI